MKKTVQCLQMIFVRKHLSTPSMIQHHNIVGFISVGHLKILNASFNPTSAFTTLVILFSSCYKVMDNQFLNPMTRKLLGICTALSLKSISVTGFCLIKQTDRPMEGLMKRQMDSRLLLCSRVYHDTTAIYSLGHGLHTLTAVPRSTQPSTLRGTSAK